jgi:hypothetical protein
MRALEATGRPAWRRPLAIATLGAFLVSLVFPIVAGIITDTASVPRWWGIADVSLAFVLGLLATAVLGAAQHDVTPKVMKTAYRVYRVLIHGIIALLVIFFVLGDRITWIRCLTGFGWRAWLLAYALPSWLALVERARDGMGQPVQDGVAHGAR